MSTTPKKKFIPREQYYTLYGLQVLAKDFDKRLNDLQKAVVEIVGEIDREGKMITMPGDGWSGEFIYSPDSHTVDEFLNLLEIEVVDE